MVIQTSLLYLRQDLLIMLGQSGNLLFEFYSIISIKIGRFGNYNERNEGKVDFLGVTKAIKDLQKLR